MKLLLLLCMAVADPRMYCGVDDPPKSKRESAIMGRVIGDDGQPVSGAVVMAFRMAAGEDSDDTPQVTTDGEGNFKLSGLGRGLYRLTARSPGFVAAFDPARYRLGDTVAIRLVKGGVITGRVTDEFGEPVVATHVMAQRLRDLEGAPDRGERTFEDGSTEFLTDDRGVYRIYGLEPGIYILKLAENVPPTLVGSQAIRYAPTYYPSSSRGVAAELTVHSGEEITGIDLRRRLQCGYSITGTIAGESGSEDRINVAVVQAAGKHLVARTYVAKDRKFSLHNLEDGDYEMFAVKYGENNELGVSLPRRVTVRGADAGPIEMRMLKLGSIAGRILLEPLKEGDACRSREPFILDELLLEAKREEKTPSLFTPELLREDALWFGVAMPEKKGVFVLKNLEPGRVRIALELPDEGWYVRAITQQAAQKTLDLSRAGIVLKQGEKVTGVDVVVAEGAATLRGKAVLAKEGLALPRRFRVHLIPVEPIAADDVLRYLETITESDGSFAFKHIAPGKYLLHVRALADGESSDRPVAWDAIERAKLRREAETAKTEIELQSCQRVNDFMLRWQGK